MTGSDTIVHCGIDIAKARLDCFIAVGRQFKSFENNEKGVIALIQWARSHGVTHLVFEPTGGYEYTLQILGAQEDIQMMRVNATWVRRFSESTGRHEKTDRLDAKLLCQYAQACHSELKELPKPSSAQLELWHLVGRRQQIVDDMAAEKCRLQQAHSKAVIKDIKAHLKQMQLHLNKIEQQIEQVIESDQSLKARAESLIAIKGIGKVSTWVLLAQMPELGTLNRGQAAKLAGVAPFCNDSGSKHGQRHIKAGRFYVRKVLYMAALAAIRSNESIRKRYKDLIARGKYSKVALVACMRHLLLQANNALKIKPAPAA